MYPDATTKRKQPYGGMPQPAQDAEPYPDPAQATTNDMQATSRPQQQQPQPAQPSVPGAPPAPPGSNFGGIISGSVGNESVGGGYAQPGDTYTYGGATSKPQDTTGAYKSALLNMLGQAQTPATLNDPALKAQSDAAALGLTRATEAGRSALAERMAQQGGAGVNSGAFNSELAGLFNRQGEQQASINAGLIGDANKAKVQQLQAALTMMGADINSEQGRALTRELAGAQNQLQRDQLEQQAKQFEQNYGLEGQRLAETMRQFDISTEAGKQQLAQQLLMFKESQAQQGRQFDVDAALKKMGIETQTALGNREIDVRDKLGTAGLNAQVSAQLLQNDQFLKALAADMGKFNATSNNASLQALLQQLGL